MARQVPRLISLLAASFVFAGCSMDASTISLPSKASGSSFFSLGRPIAYKIGTGFQLTGRVCRRSRTTLLSPPRVRLEHVTSDGVARDVTTAAVGAIYRSSDQACSSYSRHVEWAMAAGESVRACFDRGAPCPTGAPEKAVTASTVKPPTPAPISNR